MYLAGTLGCALPASGQSRNLAHPPCNEAVFQPICLEDWPGTSGQPVVRIHGVGYFDGTYQLEGDTLYQPVRVWWVHPSDAECRRRGQQRGCGSGVPQVIPSLGPLLVADVERALQTARPDSALPRRLLPQRWAGFDGLLPGSTAPPSQVPFPSDWKQHSVLLVLSTRAEAAILQIEELQRQVVAWGTRQSEPKLREAAQRFGGWTPRWLLAEHLARAARARFGSVAFANDLSELSRGTADFAIIVDLDLHADVAGFMTKLDRTLRVRKESDSPFADAWADVAGEFSWVLTDREGKVLLASIGYANNWLSWSAEGTARRNLFDDPQRSVNGRGTVLASHEIARVMARLHRLLTTGFPSVRWRVRDEHSDLLLGWIPIQQLP